MIPAGQPILTADRMRAAEDAAFAAGVSQDALMEQAGTAVARAALRLSASMPVIALAGPGNNGGDAYVAARLLRAWGRKVAVVALGTPKAGAAARMAARWEGMTAAFDDADALAGLMSAPYLLIDGLFGIGPRRPLRLDAGQRALFEAASYRIAIDLPSEVESDTGAMLWPGLADQVRVVTVALGALKPAHLLARDACGPVLLDGLGLGPHIAAAGGGRRRWHSLRQPRLRAPGSSEHKYRAKVTIVAGAMPGAARLAARGAAGAGAGYVVLVGARSEGPIDAIVHRSDAALDEVLTEDRGVLVVGPGLGRDTRARDILARALACHKPLVLDGDALTVLGTDVVDRLHARSDAASTVLTPHEGEFTRMFGAGEGSKIERTVAAADACRSTIVHKGAITVIARPGGEVTVATGGSPWLATAGSGDVLAGAVAVRGAEPAVWLHERASGLAGSAFSADRLAALLPLAVAECL